MWRQICNRIMEFEKREERNRNNFIRSIRLKDSSIFFIHKRNFEGNVDSTTCALNKKFLFRLRSGRVLPDQSCSIQNLLSGLSSTNEVAIPPSSFFRSFFSSTVGNFCSFQLPPKVPRCETATEHAETEGGKLKIHQKIYAGET